MSRARRVLLGLAGAVALWVGAGLAAAAWIDKQITDAMEDLDCE